MVTRPEEICKAPCACLAVAQETYDYRCAGSFSKIAYECKKFIPDYMLPPAGHQSSHEAP